MRSQRREQEQREAVHSRALANNAALALRLVNFGLQQHLQVLQAHMQGVQQQVS